ncbi:MAG: GTP-binding protein, partial [Eubacteriales bacterium]|nr:GTP-binding protein [Eubacteriales bacterium]
MRNYPATKIRNVVLLGHGRSGKTALAEAMLYNAKAIDRLGKAADGNTTMDFDPEEIKRQASINTSIAAIEWMEHKINIIDTPGDFDYMGEVMQGLRVADGAVITVSAKSGVSVGTEKSMRFAGKQKIPVFFYVSKIDEPNASFDRTLEQLTEHFGNTVTPFVLPIVEETEIKGFVNVFTNTAYKNAGKKLEEIPVPANMTDRVSGILESIKEHAAESDEELMEKFFNGEEFTQEELVRGLAASVVSGSLKPVFGGSSTINLGVDFVMNSIARFMPSPVDSAEFAAKDGDGNEITLKASESETLSAIVFKTIVDPFVGKISIFKVCSGVM